MRSQTSSLADCGLPAEGRPISGGQMVRRPVRQPAQAQAKCISACLTAKHLSGGEGFHTNFGAILGECAHSRHSCHPCESCSQVIVRGQCGKFVIFFHSVLFFPKESTGVMEHCPTQPFPKHFIKHPFLMSNQNALPRNTLTCVTPAPYTTAYLPVTPTTYLPLTQ